MTRALLRYPVRCALVAVAFTGPSACSAESREMKRLAGTYAGWIGTSPEKMEPHPALELRLHPDGRAAVVYGVVPGARRRSSIDSGSYRIPRVGTLVIRMPDAFRTYDVRGDTLVRQEAEVARFNAQLQAMTGTRQKTNAEAIWIRNR